MNPYKKLISMLPSGRVDVGTVTASYSDGVLLLLQDGGTLIVKGEGTVGERVYIKDGYIIGAAPNLVGDTFEV